MLEGEAPTGREGDRPGHELWLAMRAAYQRYQNASAALEALTSSYEDLGIEKAAEQQRTTFENYIEARLQFSEFLLSGKAEDPANFGGSNARRKSTGPGQPETAGFWTGFRTSRLARMAIAVALLLPTAFSLTYLVREQRRVHDLDLVRDAMEEIAKNRTTNQTQSLAARLPAPNAPPQVATQPGNLPAPQVRPDRALERKAAPGIGAKGWRPVRPTLPPPQRRIRDARQTADSSREMPQRKSMPARDEKGASVAAKSHATVQLDRDAERNYYRFTLTPSSHFERVGPIRLSLRNMDANRRFLDLSVMVDDLVIDQKHVSLYQPVRIHLRDRPMPAVLVVNRITRNQVQGYLSEARYQPSKTRRRGLTPLSPTETIVHPTRYAQIRPGLLASSQPPRACWIETSEPRRCL
jgi:hypothetical protein